MQTWEATLKPTTIAAHHALEHAQLGALSDDELLAHLEACCANSTYLGTAAKSTLV